VTYESDLDKALAGADAVIALRLQRERQESGLLPSLREYSRVWGLTADRVGRMRPGAPVMHPGPMNRGVEIGADVTDHPVPTARGHVDALDRPGLGVDVDEDRVRHHRVQVAGFARGRP